MPKSMSKLIPDENEHWRSTQHQDYVVCPACFCPVSVLEKDKHIKWHELLFDMIAAVGRTHGSNKG